MVRYLTIPFYQKKCVGIALVANVILGTSNDAKVKCYNMLYPSIKPLSNHKSKTNGKCYIYNLHYTKHNIFIVILTKIY